MGWHKKGATVGQEGSNISHSDTSSNWHNL